jgi:thiol-disulfide isomerase/thioredoxin
VRRVRPPADDIEAPPFPPRATWINTGALRMDRERGHPVLVEFWDFARPNSIRTLPYVSAWAAKYAPHGLRVVGIHTPGFHVSEDPERVRDACARLGVTHPVVVDAEYEMWNLYGNRGWPARYLWNGGGMLFDYHYGEGGYEETERAIQELLGVEEDLLEPLRPEDEPGAVVHAQTADHPGLYQGPYEAGGVWVVAEGDGVVIANGQEVAVSYPGCHPVLAHAHHTVGELVLEAGPGVEVEATCFTPGVVPAA